MADGTLIVHKNRTNVYRVELPYPAPDDIFESEIREDRDQDSELVATFDVEFIEPGDVDEEINTILKLTLDDSEVAGVTIEKAFFDIKRTSNGEPLPVFDAPVRVRFRDTVTE